MMRLMLIACFTIFVMNFFFSWSGLCASENSQLSSIESQVQHIEKNKQETSRIISEEKAQVESRQKLLRAEIKSLEEKNKLLQAEFKTLLQKETDLRNTLQGQQREREAIRGAVRSAARDARELFQILPSTAEFPDRTALIQRLLDQERFPRLSDTSDFLKILEQAITHSGEVARRPGVIIGTSGREQNASVVRAGEFTALYEDSEGNFGFLRPDRTGTRLEAVAGNPGWFTRSTMKKFLSGEDEVVPVDISGGAVLKQLEQQKTFWEGIRKGGPLIWPIIFTGIFGILIGLERTFRLSRCSGKSEKLLPSLLALVGQNETAKGMELCKASSTIPLGRVLGSIMAQSGKEKEILESSLEEGLLKEMAPLERFLPTLSVLAAVAPLLGLLGTVTGMISTFQTITLFGTSDPQLMSGGISEALITTQLGLAVAIPIMLLHHFLDRRVDTIIGELEEKGTTLTLALLGQSTRTEKE